MKALLVLIFTAVLLCPLSQAQIDQSTWRLEPIWTIGGDDGDVFFSRIEHIVVGKDGTVYLHENRISTVRMFTSEGKEIGEFGSNGKAPGEFEDISNMYVAPNGNLFLSDFMQGRISEVTSKGRHLRVITAPPVVQYRSPLLGYDLKNDLLAVLFKNPSSKDDVGKLFYTLDLKTSTIGLPMTSSQKTGSFKSRVSGRFRTIKRTRDCYENIKVHREPDFIALRKAETGSKASEECRKM